MNKKLLVFVAVLLVCVLCGFGFYKWNDLRTWQLTQHPDDSGIQGMFYSLVNPLEKKLILVDGGNPANAERVSRVIEEHGGHVHAWFLTHYHIDHVGAFNELYEKYKDRIDRIYVNPLDWETFESVYHEWDSPESFERYLQLTKDAENIQILYAGDTLSIGNLKIQVFSSFDEHVRELSRDWVNDSSLVFKVSGEKDSVLFMGDLSRAGVPLGQYILDTWGVENVRADYVQAGHHGNWGQPISFYEQLSPKVIFQDGPESLMTGEQYDAKDLKAWCAANGITTYDFTQAPVTLPLK